MPTEHTGSQKAFLLLFMKKWKNSLLKKVPMWMGFIFAPIILRPRKRNFGKIVPVVNLKTVFSRLQPKICI